MDMISQGRKLDEKAGIPGGVLLCLAAVSSYGHCRVDSRRAALSCMEIPDRLHSRENDAVCDNDTDRRVGLGRLYKITCLNQYFTIRR